MAQAIPQVQPIEQYGPYGSQERPTFNFVLEKDDVITKIYIESGDVVDSLGFEVVDSSGNTKTIWSNGSVTGKRSVNNVSQGGHESHTISLGGVEYLTQISGFEGDYQGVRHVVQLVIHTSNVPQGYGPYGRKYATNITEFKSPEGKVVGLFGAQGTYLHSLGVSLLKGN